MAEWLERLTAEQNIDGSNQTLGPQLGCRSPTVHPAANGYLVATLGKLKTARKGTGHPTSVCRRCGMILFSKTTLSSLQCSRTLPVWIAMSHFHFLIFCFHVWSVVISLLAVLKVVILVSANAVKKFIPTYDSVRWGVPV